MTEVTFHAPTAAEIQAIQHEAARLRSIAFGNALRKLFSAVKSLAPRGFSLSPRCARPLH
ncbi:hypothetical protein QEZ52_14415 [Aliisedimentitalea scapharcae]|uniref:Uncharacterized protein n=1 Tax=Aliisedimentitalea scapharcae TaxID=1524259 RepID=A0ABZ2XQ07_9RHOB|nr:hypothetical protein K3727_14315 [Rhodobacteraceae bacterium M382]